MPGIELESCKRRVMPDELYVLHSTWIIRRLTLIQSASCFCHNYDITCDKGSWYSTATLLTVFDVWEGVWMEKVVACLEDVYLFSPKENHR